jgi:hypothetical protein
LSYQVDSQLIGDMAVAATVPDIAAAWKSYGLRMNPPPLVPVTDLPATMTKSTFLPLLKPGALLDGGKNGTVIDLGNNKYSVDGGWSLGNVRVKNGGLIIKGSAVISESDWTWPNYAPLTASSVIPRMLSTSGLATDHLVLIDVDMHDANATAILLPAGMLELDGVHMWNIYEHPDTDPLNVDHCDWIGALNGNAIVSVKDSYFEGADGPAKAPAGARLNFQAFAGPAIVGFFNIWVQGAEGAAFQFNARNGQKITGKRTGVTSWDHVGEHPQDRLDLTSTGGIVDVTDTGLSTVAPPAGSLDPATAARAANG